MGNSIQNKELTDNIDLLISKYYENNLGIDLYDEQNSVFYEDIVKAITKTNNFLLRKSDKILYRLIKAEEINTKNLGLHYVTDIRSIDNHFLFNIGLEINAKLYKYKIVKVKVPYENIDIQGTYFANVNYPTEFEIELKHDNNIEILDIFNYNPT